MTQERQINSERKMDLEFFQDEDIAARDYVAVGMRINGMFIPYNNDNGNQPDIPFIRRSNRENIPEISMAEHLFRNRDLQQLALFPTTERSRKKKKMRRSMTIPKLCSICLTEKPQRKCIPCRHWAFCKSCWDAYKDDFCPICKQNIIYVVKREN